LRLPASPERSGPARFINSEFGAAISCFPFQNRGVDWFHQ
jgi:hypothetical protein